MRIRRVTAHAFGPLAGETLDLAEGLTVIYGPNESAKSTWHAALYAALCGRRRTNPTAEERAFEERHRPWDRTDWEVSAEVALADGRRVELRHDLAGRVACYAKDLDLVADYSSEITGSEKGEVPDASRWLGLDRRTFLATACVPQSDVLSVTERADGLREHVQRAAATAGADETAAGALKALSEYQSTRVGTPLTRTRPLQLAEAAAVEAAESLSHARRDHQEYQRRAVEARELSAAAEAARVRLHGHEAAQAHAEAARLRGEADRLSRRATDAAELTAVLAAPTAVELDAAGVVAAVASWETLPPAPAVSSSVDSARAGRGWSVAAFGGAAVLVLVAVVLFAVGSVAPAVAALGFGLVAAAVGLFLSGRAAGRSTATAGANGPGDERRQWDQARARAAADLLAAAATIGVHAHQAADALPVLTAWLAEEPARAARREQIVARRARLADLLDGGTLPDLQHRASAAADLAARAADRLPAAPHGDANADGAGLRQQHAELDRRAFVAERELSEYAAARTPVPEAEERAQATAAELARVQDLDRILTLTKQYLIRSQDRVHRTIAPRIAAAVRRDLATVTAGRYTDVVVDPGTLAVQVRGPGGRPRDADRLSVGTAEQVYLLLRLALAEQLVRPGESCPLLLDEVTVHADWARAERMLQLLRDVAQRHQVVLFTQQEQVRDWAHTHLDERHAIRELPPVSTV
jgi:DNA repair exonuclease SbcCD ATPase subunit